MTQITIQDGKAVLVDGKIGSGAACCCDDQCQGPCETSADCGSGCDCVDGECVEEEAVEGGCCGWICDYVAEIIWPEIENPEDIPAIDTPDGWILMPGGVPGIGEYRKTIKGVENCDDPELVAAKVAELQAELDALVAGQGGSSLVQLDPALSGQGCFAAFEQECLEDYAGTWYATQEECWENCPNPLP